MNVKITLCSFFDDNFSDIFKIPIDLIFQEYNRQAGDLPKIKRVSGLPSIKPNIICALNEKG